ncbi:MAG TPA: sulfatase-like hydrolase/transferase [Gemmataceae bacterium]|jgi:choline-sulfatase
MRQLCLAAAVVMMMVGSVRAEPRRPNILWICADDHAPYVCGAYGNKTVRTPNLDRLASEGVRFNRAYCNSPVCTASRQSFLTGRYPRSLGVTLLQTPLPADQPTLATMLRAAGYDTAAVGKMHFNSNLTHGFDRRIDVPHHTRYLREHPPKSLPSEIEVLPPWRPFRDPARVWLNSACLPFGARDEDMTGTFFARQAADYLRQRGDKPFFLMVSFYEPHSPFRFPIEYRGKYRAEQFVAAKVGPEDDAQIPAIFRNLTDREKQGIIAAYYTSTEFMDKNAGLVLDALKQSGRTADTLVIYTGDHGYMLGQHGRFEKHCCYEPAVRAPLLFRWSEQLKAGQSTNALVEFIDIVPTVLDYCRVSAPATVQGKSLTPLLRGETKKHRERVVVEYSENEEAMIRTERWKFIYCTGKRERQDGYTTGRPLPGRTIRLYDEENDPEEMTNLADKPEHARLIADFTTQLAEHLKLTARLPELISKDSDVYSVLDFCLQPRDVKLPTKK